MADNTILDPGTGGDTIRDKDRAGVKTPIVAIDLNPAGSETLMSGTMPVDSELPAAAALSDAAANPTTPTVGAGVLVWNGTTWDRAKGDTTNGMFVNVKTSVLPTGAATSAKQPALGTAGTPSADVLTVQGVTSMTALKVDGSAVTQPVSGTVTANLGTAAVTNAGTFAVQDSQKVVDNAAFTDGTTPVQPAGYIFDEVAGTALTENDTGAARIDSKRAQVLVVEDATTRGQRAAVSAAGAVKVDGSAVTQPVSLAGTQAVNHAQVAGTTTDVNTGNASAGTQRVVLASNQPVVPISDNAGSLTVDAPVGTPVFVTVTPSTSGGWTPKVFSAAAAAAKTLINGAACTFGGHLTIYNPNVSVAYIQVFDAATTGAVTVGTTPATALIIIPATSAANVEITNGVHMASGIVIAATTTAGGSTGVTTALDGTILYK